MTEPELKQLLKNTINNSTPLRDEGGMTSKILGEMQTSPMVPAGVKGILDTTGSTTGNALLRQDLEPILHAIFVKRFPVWERLTKKQSNGLLHQATRVTSPDSGSAGSKHINESCNVSCTTGAYLKLAVPVRDFFTDYAGHFN